MSKKQLIILFIFLYSSLCADTFSLLTNKKYDEAEKALHTQLQTAPDDVLALYNSGVLAEKNDKIGDAVFYYIQALASAPTFSEAQQNLNIIAKKHHLTIPKRVTQPTELLHPFFLLMGVVFLSIFFIIWNLFKPHWKIKVALVPLILTTLLLGFWLVGKYQNYSAYSFAVVRTKHQLMSGPDSSLTAVSSLKEGEIVRLFAISGKWSKVESAQDGVEGWVSSAALGMIQRSYK